MSWLSDLGKWAAATVYNIIKYSPIGGLIYAAQYGIVHGVIPALENAGLWGPENGKDTTNRPGIRGASNSLNKWGKTPIVLGTHYVVPPMAGIPYTELSGSDGADQYIHASYIIGYGPLEVRTIKIGDNLLASNSSGAMGALAVDGGNFIDGSGTPVVQAELRYDSTDMTYYPARITEKRTDMEMRSPLGTPTMLYQRTAPGCTKIEIDFEFPNGLRKGDSGSASVRIKTEYIDPLTETWSTPHTITDTTITKSLATTARYSYATGTLTAKEYEVRVYRVTADTTDNTIADKVYWSCIRSTISGPPVRAGFAAKVVRLSIRAKASDSINSSLGQVSCVATSKLPIYSGSGTGRAQWNTVAATDNPAAIALYLLRNDATGDGVGVGPNPAPFVDANIDYPAFEALYQWYATRSAAGKPNTCNAVISEGVTIRDAVARVLSTCRAAIVKRGNIVSIAQDDVRTTPIALITPKNSWNYVGTKKFPDLPHGYRASFINKDAGYQQDVRIVLADGYIYDTENDGNLRDAWGTIRTVGGGYTLATKLESTEVWGITDPAMLFREIRVRLAALSLRPETHSVEQDFQSLVYQYGDLVRLGHDVPGFGAMGGRIKSVTVDGSGNATGITTDEIVTLVAGHSYSICYQRTSDGRVLFANLTTVDGSSYSMSFSTPIPAADIPAINDLFHYGEGTEGGTAPMIVVGLEPGDDFSSTVHMQDYGAGIFSADTGTVPAFNSRVSLPVEHDFAGALGMRKVQQIASDQATQAAVQAQATSTEKANAIIQAMAPTATPSAAYRGSYPYASPPGSPSANDTCVLYSTTAAECGIYMYSGSAWVRQTSPTLTMVADGWTDILIASNSGFSSVPDYVGSTAYFNQIAALSIFALKILLGVGGSIRGGSRFDEDGNDLGSGDGVWIGANGIIKAINGIFSGTLSGTLDVSNTSFPVVTPGSNVAARSLTEQAYTVPSFGISRMRWVQFPCSGSVRVSFDAKSSGSGESLIIAKSSQEFGLPDNTSQSYTSRSLTTSYVTYTEDISSVSSGDFFGIMIDSAITGHVIYLKNVLITVNENVGIIPYLSKTQYV